MAIGPEGGSSLSVDEHEGRLILDDSMLSRQQILDIVTTPKEGTPTGERIVDTVHDLGKVGLYGAFAPLTPHIFEQIRGFYRYEHLIRTGRNVVNSYHKQLQNTGLGIFDEDHIHEYLSDANDYFGTNVEVLDLETHEELKDYGLYVISIYGHNRQLGVAAHNREMFGDANHGHPIFAKVFINPNFAQAIEMQAVENTGEAPPAWDTSRSITKYFEFRSRDGNTPSTKDLATIFNTNEQTIVNAIKFEALPHKIKDLVKDKKLPYENSYFFHDLLQSYPEDYVLDLAASCALRNVSGNELKHEIESRIIALNLPVEFISLIDDKAITDAEVKEAYRLRKKGLNDDDIKEFALWLVKEKRNFMEVRNYVNARIKAIEMGMADLFSGSELSGGGGKKKDYDNQIVTVKRTAAHTITKLRAIISAYRSGLISTEAAEQAPIGQAISEQLKDELTHIANGDTAHLDPEIMALLAELLVVEGLHASGSILPGELQQRVASAILSRTEGFRAEQGSLL